MESDFISGNIFGDISNDGIGRNDLSIYRLQNTSLVLLVQADQSNDRHKVVVSDMIAIFFMLFSSFYYMMRTCLFISLCLGAMKEADEKEDEQTCKTILEPDGNVKAIADKES